jgi:DNA-directed RNA polymerase beta' subunit
MDNEKDIVDITEHLEPLTDLESTSEKWKKRCLPIVYVVTICTLLALMWLLSELAWTIHTGRNKADDLIERIAKSQATRNVEDFTSNLQATGGRAEAIAEHLHNSTLALITQELIDDSHSYVRNQAASVLGASNNSRKLANNLNELVKDLKPRIGRNLDQNEKLLASIEKVANEIEQQVKQNGDSAKGVLDETTNTLKVIKTVTMDTQEEVAALLQQTTLAMKGVQILTNDPELAKSVKNANLILGNLGIVTESFAKVTHDFAFGTPPKNKFDKYFVRPLKYVVQFFAGAGNVIVFASKF